MLHCPYDTPTFKTNVLHLVSNEGWLKMSFAAIQMANLALPQSSLAINGNVLHYF